jgi:hypothetical protein
MHGRKRKRMRRKSSKSSGACGANEHGRKRQVERARGQWTSELGKVITEVFGEDLRGNRVQSLIYGVGGAVRAFAKLEQAHEV